MLPCAKCFKSAIYPVEILQISKSFSIKPAAGTNENIVRNVSVYLYKAFNLRSILSS